MYNPTILIVRLSSKSNQIYNQTTDRIIYNQALNRIRHTYESFMKSDTQYNRADEKSESRFHATRSTAEQWALPQLGCRVVLYWYLCYTVIIIIYYYIFCFLLFVFVFLHIVFFTSFSFFLVLPLHPWHSSHIARLVLLLHRF